MAKKISQLTQATEVKSDDVTVIVQDGETKKLPLNMMVTKQDIEDKKVTGLAKLDEIEATYENDTYTPTITVKNKSSVKVGEGDGVDYSANVMDGPAKSAILKGNTLINYFNPNTVTKLPDEGFPLNEPDFSKQKIFSYIPLQPYEDNTEYTIIVWLKDVVNPNNARLNISFGGGGNDLFINAFKNGINISKGTTKTVSGNPNIRIGDTDVKTGAGATLIGAVILKGDYTNISLNSPFYGMQSVKMPVLTTTGKNLYSFGDVSFISAYTSWHDTLGGNNMYGSYVPKSKAKFMLKAGKYTLSFGEANNFKTLQLITMDEKIIRNGVGSFELTDDTYVVLRGIVSTSNEISSLKNIQIEQDTQATTYEPYKSNILSTSEGVTLRGIGEVKDELNLLTGELTQRVEEFRCEVKRVTVHGTNMNGNTRFLVELINPCPTFKDVLFNNHNFRYNPKSYNYGVNGDFYFNRQTEIFLTFKPSKYTTDTLKTYLEENPLILIIQLETESVKTVDLIPSGTHPSTTPYCWKDGHIQLSSSGLLPSLEYSVVTSRAGQISQNAAMIVKNDKRIFDLEILLAGGLVNTTYQALTLQNQVETGLSKVSLSSEKEPDYLLYHMIMKLIDEKAYKLDDLAEKVSVFYLYEKLSDEQFETIYAALYPFAEDEYFESDIPGDDEVIEEPIVDESLEEVEDEVVM